MNRWTTRRTVVLLAVLGAILAALAAAQPWGSGRAVREVVGIREVTATGGELAPLVPALALVGAAAALAAATTGRALRRVAVAAMALTGLGTVGATLALLHDLAGALGQRAARQGASSEPIAMTATATAWPWAAVVGGVVVAVAAALAHAGLSRWPLPSARYERTTSGGPSTAGTRGDETDTRSLWERVGDEDA